MCLLAGIANKRNTAERLFHHPFEIALKEAIDEKDVKRALMVSHKNIALPVTEVVTPLDTDGKKKESANESAPKHGGIIPPEMSATDHAAHTCDKSCENCGDETER